MKRRDHIITSKIYLWLSLAALILITACNTNSDAITPTGKADRGKRLVADNAMVSSAHPLASEAGLKMLKEGGNAVDAAVATAFALNVVEPNMSGIGGGGSMLIWNQQKKETDYVDFYTAKRAETYKDINYDEIDEEESNLLSVGIPGSVDGLLQALEKHGTMSREQVMAPAIKYAKEGFPIYLTLAQFILENEEKLKRFEGASKTFFPNDKPLAVGQILKQPELAQTLQNISQSGSSAFYEGDNVKDIISLLNAHGNPVSEVDFSEYEPQWDKPALCGGYHDYKVLSAPLPQTGLYIVQALNILEDYELNEIGLPTVSPKAFDILSSAMRTSIADRVEYVSDPNWEEIPILGLISDEYTDQRKKLVGTGMAAEEVTHGDPPQIFANDSETGCSTIKFASNSTMISTESNDFGYVVSNDLDRDYDETEGQGETTHISVVDASGNAVSLSTTLSHVFGSGAWVNGFMLNNSGYNFSYHETEEDWESDHAYRIRSSTISPTIILNKNDEVRLVIGAPGGGRIPTAVLQNIIYILEYNLDPLDAIKMPRIFPDRESTEVQIEKGFDLNILDEVREMGYDIQSLSQGYARLYLVSKENGKLIGVADPRHDGEVRGY
ncbi:gamma-glutamyltransferase [Gracilimonas sp. Q87]|uniref:gamma-glutamyltransferase n=1 Tax=Gracilimonas sp. Q87 TaxID=3384766 RepID=UPI00398443FF